MYDWVNAHGVPREESLVDLRTMSQVAIAHIAVGIETMNRQANGDEYSLTVADFGSWAGDLVSVAFDYYEKGAGYSAAEFAISWIGGRSVDSRLSEANLIEDADAFLIWNKTQGAPATSFAALISETYTATGDWPTRFTRWFQERFAGDWNNVRDLAVEAMIGDDSVFAATRNLFWSQRNFDGTSLSMADKEALGVGFATVLQRRVEEEGVL
ncbi:hypothetical protein IF650_02480 [Cellulosimicrobium terreum]|nr:hypothetical protein [Cellulosimicrobium terreum]